ncbi:ABC transporter substrate-binding protein [Rhizobiales bacterium]|uniref:ABC transporter substrate-binding protein n=1 Tax=Hongsoonwoonella zoysiae TaxID=2821844 RepID=UPI00155FF99F|nr:ABC transporter substrate-binding protein [Hongsoonwoonella zoysiae]NRG16607.1 ABC transporter substrate-binding protein [Hongsoonwoonella zoysiae]
MKFQALFGASALALAAVLTASPVTAASVSISCGAVGQELELCREAADAWANKTGNEVVVVSTPNSTTERLALYQQLLAAGADDIDVFQIDVIWPGILGSHFIDLAPYSVGAEKEHFSSIIENNTVEGKLVAMPWFTDAGVLYYRSDLLEKHGEDVPQTWEEMTATAKKIQDAERAEGNDGMWGFVFQGKAYEGLTCDALEWIDAYGGGTIVNAEGDVTVNNESALAALKVAGSWVGNIAPEGVLNYAEEEARGVFQSGNAVFMRNWPYAWALGNSVDSPVKGKIGVTALPKGGSDGKHTGTLGGWQLAVSKYSKNPEVAADLVMYLTSYDEQKRRAVKGAYNPTIAALYEDQEVLEANPFFGELYDTFVNAVARPSRVTGTTYNQVSNEFWNETHAVLSGTKSPEDALSDLERSLKRMSRRGW